MGFPLPSAAVFLARHVAENTIRGLYRDTYPYLTALIAAAGGFAKPDEIAKLPSLEKPAQQQQLVPAQQLAAAPAATATAQYTPTVVQTISNPDGTVSIIQVGLHFFPTRSLF